MLLKKLFKTTSPKALLIIANLIFLFIVLFLYAILLHGSSTSDYNGHATSLVRRPFHKLQENAMFEETKSAKDQEKGRSNSIEWEKPSFLSGTKGEMKIGTINMENEDIFEWKAHEQIFPVSFERVSELIKWEALFPEWIDEEEEFHVPSCPKIPMPNYEDYEYMDVIVAQLPCKIEEVGWNRDVFRLQVHLVVANLAVRRGMRDLDGKTKVVFWSKCRPMVELFRCDDLLTREGHWWYYRPEMERLEQKVSMPVGSCNLALPLWDKGINKVHYVSRTKGFNEAATKRQAYATVIHSKEIYVCGAIALAQSLLQTRTRHDLILLLDTSISQPNRDALSRAGWKLRFIKRIRNPMANKKSYNKHNYSKFRLWQLTEYEKIIFIDSDIIVLRNLDILFHFPQMSATGNDGTLFNSGIMVIEPSNCTFHTIMQRVKEVVSYNEGDQGFLNEVFVWWHRLPRRVNFLKNFWSNSSEEAKMKNKLFGSDPPKLYSIHYLGLKPWLCYRDYDCNFDIPSQRVYASDVAHARWWKVHDAMDEGLQKFCVLSDQRKFELKLGRKEAKISRSKDRHWRIRVTDPRISI